MSVGFLALSTHARIYSQKAGFHPELIVTRYFDILFVLLLAYFWETIEHYLELGLL